MQQGSIKETKHPLKLQKMMRLERSKFLLSFRLAALAHALGTPMRGAATDLAACCDSVNIS